MKTFIPGLLALLIVMTGCKSNKSFSHQRYTHFKHKTTNSVMASTASPVQKQNSIVTDAPEIVVIRASQEETKTKPLSYTEAIVNHVVLPVTQKGKEQAMNLVSSNSKVPVTQVAKIKPLNIVQKQEKRGLLFGVIDALLSIILLAVFVALVIILVLVLI